MACALRQAACRTSPFDRIFFPQAPDDGTIQALARGLASEIEEDGRQGGSCCVFKVVDTDVLLDNGACEMIAFGKWKVTRPACTDTRDEIDNDDPDRFGPGSNVEACALVFDEMEKKKETHVGKSAHIHLQTIHTDPKHQRRGAGLLLAKRCIQDGDAMRLPIWLESSEEGHQLYLKCGFGDVEEFVTDLGQWGATLPHRSWLMVKHARSASPERLKN